MYIGDFAVGAIFNTKFSTQKGDGTPITLAGSPVAKVYKDDDTTESASGVTLSVGFDGITGLHNIEIDTTSDGTFYAAGSDFSVILTAGTVDSVSVVGRVIAQFSIEHRSVGSGTAPSAATVAAAVWDRLLSAITTSSSIGKLLKDNIDATISSRLASGSYSTPPSAASIATAVWDTLLSALTTASSIGERIKDYLDAAISSRKPNTNSTGGSVVADGGNSPTQFKTDLTSTEDDYPKRMLVRFTSGALAEQVDFVSTYDGTTKILTVTHGFTGTPAVGDDFVFIND